MAVQHQQRLNAAAARRRARDAANVDSAVLRPLDAPTETDSEVRVETVGIGRLLAERLANSPDAVHALTPGEFQDFICDRLYAMGFEPKQTGSVYSKDGGIDVVFWPRLDGVFPFLGAAQLKHHRDPDTKQGPAAVRDFAGAIAGHPFSAALLITNTWFTADAEWFAKQHAKLMRLRDFDDIKRWLRNDFANAKEWREVPTSIELCPGVVVSVRSQFWMRRRPTPVYGGRRLRLHEGGRC